MSRSVTLALSTGIAVLASALLALFATPTGGAAFACDPVAVVASSVADDPAALDRARLEAKIAALLEEIEALERSLAGSINTRASEPAETTGFRVRSRGATASVAGDEIVLLEQTDGRSPVAVMIAQRPEPPPSQVRERIQIRGRAPTAASEPTHRIFHFEESVSPPARVRAQAPVTPCSGCCSGSGVGARAVAPALPAPSPLRWRVAAPRSPAAPTRLRQLAPVAPIPDAPQARGVIRRFAVPGAQGETRMIIERSPAPVPSRPAPCCSDSATPLPAEHPEPFGMLRSTGVHRSTAPIQSIRVREERFAPISLPGFPESGNAQWLERGPRAGALEYY